MARKKKEKDNAADLIKAIVEGMQEKKGRDIVVLDMRELPNAITDYFVICHAENIRQVNALGDSVQEFTMVLANEKPWHSEGTSNANWVLLDYVNVVVHIFNKESREFYNIENLWADAKRTEYESTY
ncbi:MAG: ribosome silencing factor [Flavobacteriales bacterium]|nr:ribosome silencing factor [Flavobacteriales bacterium]